LTYDHVIPKSQFYPDKKDATNWLNITTACVKCNRKKSNKTPEQANMKLLNIPKKPFYEPRYLPLAKELHTIYGSSSDQKEWIKYIDGYF
jgi:5-methylcytosine-specific restriction endonuclease McrA